MTEQSSIPDTGSEPSALSRDVAQMFLSAEHAGLRLAILGRIVALLLMGVWLVGARLDDPPRAIGYLLVLTLLALLGGLHYLIIGTRFDRRWVKYAFVSLDITLLSFLIATQPLYMSASDLPAGMLFRAPVFPFYFVVIGIAAFSLSSLLVVWSGVFGAIAWISAYSFAIRDTVVRNWGDIPASPSTSEVLDVLLDPNFAGGEARIQEAMVLVVVALLIAIVIRRARNTLIRQLESERDRSQIAQLFGRFVPQDVVQIMIANRGALAPVEREATILFADIAGFTRMTERVGAVRTTEIVNAYFDEATQIIAAHNGIVTQFQGDGLLATFNVPLENESHAQDAYNAACAILDRVTGSTFSGERLALRIGINTGPVIAGNVGGGGRQSYTVYGDTVNLAARLEALCKEHSTALLLSAATARAIDNAGLHSVGDIAVRGFSEPVKVFGIQS